MILRLLSYADCTHVFQPGGRDAVLSTAERALHEAFRVEKRKREWLLGRTATKTAAQRLLQFEHSMDVALKDIEILPDEDHAPNIKVIGEHAHAAPSLAASLSHRGEFAVAVVEVSSEGRSFGVDIDRVEPRSATFLRDYFNPREQKAMLCERPLEQDRQVTVFWCVKEAILKALKKGLSVSADRVEVLEVGPADTVKVQFDSALGKGKATVRCWHLPNYVITWAVVDTSKGKTVVPQRPSNTTLWAPETATPDAELPAPALKVVGSS